MENGIIDLLVRIKNGYMNRRDSIESPYSSFREAMLNKLKELGYISGFAVEGEIIKKITIDLVYREREPALTDVVVVSKPGKRIYIPYRKLKPVLNNYGYAILSTPKGIKTNKEAVREKLGGELLFNIW